MSPAPRFPRADYHPLAPYDPGRTPVAVDLSDNTNLWGAHPDALAAIRQAPPEALTRYPSVYAGALKEAVGRRLGVPPECVTTGCGSDDLLDSAFRAAATPPSRISYPAPTFSMVEIFARMNGMEASALPWERAMEEPALLLEEGPDLVYLCAPNNPTGLPLARKWLQELMAAGGPQGPILALDEAYADYAGESFAPLAPGSRRLLVLRTLSKLYGLAGLRVGFAVGPPGLVAEVEKSRGPYKVGHLAEAAALAALEDASGWIPGVLQATLQNRARLAGELEGRGFSPPPSQANFLLVPVAPASAAKVAAALKERGVAVRPFPALPGIGDALRVTVGPWEMMERFLEAWDAALPPPSGTGRKERAGSV